MKRVLVLILSLFISRSLSAQKEVLQNKDFITRPFQLTLISPLGTNGLESGRTISRVSLNLIIGYAAGLDGVEFGGFANLARQQVKGVQMAGFLNYAGGNAEASQLAGFANIVADSSAGFQLAGFTNISAKHEGLQMSGFGNFASRKIKGLQLAGFMNVSKETEGSQLAGFLNITKKLKGLQLGIINVVGSVEEGTPVGYSPS